MSEKEHVARASAIVGGTLALFKLAIGILSGSLGLISEGIHSSLDFVVTLATWFSVKTADEPADREHHYGHGKIENLTAFAQSMLLLVTAVWIVVNAYHHLARREKLDLGGGWLAAIGVVAVSIVVDLTRSRALARTARKFKSQALEADALHFGTELLSSAAVLMGLILVKFGGEKFNTADSIAAMCVAAIMFFTALRLARRSADVLVDRAPEGVEQQVHDLIEGVAGVEQVLRVRARQSGARTFVDATITVNPTIGLQAGHEISDNVETRVTEKFPNSDVLVHVEPAVSAAGAADPAALVRKTAEDMNIRLHAVRIRELHGHLYIHFHAEFPPEMTLAAAHARVTELEEAVRGKLPAVADIISHIEPINE